LETLYFQTIIILTAILKKIDECPGCSLDLMIVSGGANDSMGGAFSTVKLA
jgi:hypothetical protein